MAELWPAVLAEVQERPMVRALIENARPSKLDGGELTLSWAESAAFYKRKAEDPDCRDQIARAIRTVTGSSLRLAYALAEDDAEHGRDDVPPLSEDELIDTLHARVRRRGASSRRGVLMPQPPNLNALLQQAQKMQADMMAAQEKLKDETVEASAGGGMVKVVMSGDLELKSLVIDPDAVDPEDVEMLQDMVMAAINEAMRQAMELQGKATGMGGMDAGAAMDALGGLGLGGLGGGGGGRRRPPGRRARTAPRAASRGSRCSPRRSSAWSPSWASSPASATAPRSGSPSTSCAPRRRTRTRSPTRSATSRTRSGSARSASTSPRGRAARSAPTSAATRR